MTLSMKLFLLLAAAGSLLLASCNTVSGFGQDVQRAGQGLENKGQGRDW
jgi:predicted small secreted protein